MGDLLQFHESGAQLDDGPVDWHTIHETVLVPASNRRRLLDNAAHHGDRPVDDGWLTTHQGLGPIGLSPDEQTVAGYDHDPVLTVWHRIRWEPLAHTDTQQLDGQGDG